MKTRYLLYILPLIILAACEPKVDEFTPSKGNADFTSYIAVGDFWTAGFADASLYQSGQVNSFPNILSQKFATVGGGQFTQPLMVDDYGFGLATGTPTPKLVLGYQQDCLQNTVLVPAYADVQVDPANFASIASQGPFNNIGMPGLKSIYVAVPGFAALNPYFSRFAPTPTTTVIEMINPDATFFTLWLGIFDIEYYAILGGVGDQITPVQQFSGSLSATLDVLMANGAKGAVANIPEITDMPFFHTIPYNAIPLDDQQAAMLNAAYAPLNMMIKAANSDDTIHFAAGQNAMVITDASLPWGMRQIKSSEFALMTIPQDSLKCGGWGTMKPVPGKYILDNLEIKNVQDAVTNYNIAITQLVADKDVALVDMYSVMKEVSTTGLEFDGVMLNSTFVTGNFFSLDGQNPTPRGSAVVAYYFIDAINAKFGASLPQVIVSDYEGVVLP